MSDEKIVFFDVDGVLTTNVRGSGFTSEYLSKYWGLSHDKVLELYRPFSAKINAGEKTHEDVWDEFCSKLGKDGTPISVLYEAFSNTPVDKKMYLLIEKIKKNDECTLGIITNNSIERIETLRDKLGLEAFDVVIISAREKAMKPKEEIYRIALEKAEVSPENAAFIDNQEKNVVIPNQIGMKGIFFDDIKRDYDALFSQIDEFLHKCNNDN
jgi:putative hydrolase of the HAD superfamily